MSIVSFLAGENKNAWGWLPVDPVVHPVGAGFSRRGRPGRPSRNRTSFGRAGWSRRLQRVRSLLVIAVTEPRHVKEDESNHCNKGPMR